jgi:flagellar hook-basal body complex protein FliE
MVQNGVPVNPSLPPVGPAGPRGVPGAGRPAPGEGGARFSEVLKASLDRVNEMQLELDDQIEKLATGETEDVGRVVVTAQKANIAFELLMQVRNRLVEAYQEIMRMRT